jgi:hypothetical protein
MKHPDPWQQLATSARKAPASEPRPPTHAWVTAVSSKAMQVASLGQPSLKTIILAWLASWKVLIPVIVIVLGSAGWWAGPGNFGRPTPAQRYDGWAGETVKQIRAWLPMECEQAGRVTLLMQDRTRQLKTLPPSGPAASALLEQTQRELNELLTLEQRQAFAAEQARLRAKWFPPK